MTGLSRGEILCRHFLSPFKFFGFKEWTLSVAGTVAIKRHLFFVSGSFLGKKRKWRWPGEGHGSWCWVLSGSLWSRTRQRCFSFYNHLGVSCPVKRLLKSLLFCSHKCLYYDPQENSRKTHSCEEFNVICLMGPRYITDTGTDLHLMSRHLKGVHPKILSALCNYKTFAKVTKMFLFLKVVVFVLFTMVGK